jgi:cysteine desulfurase/selenocysteine lyase
MGGEARGESLHVKPGRSGGETTPLGGISDGGISDGGIPHGGIAGGGTSGGRAIGQVRSDFPILSRSVGGKPLAYLDNAATSQKPRVVLEAMDSYYARSNANVHRAIHALGEEATAAYEAARSKVRRFLGAERDTEIVFTRGTTESINLAASSWGDANLGRDDVVLVTEMEHHSDIVPWQLLCARRGCRLSVAHVEDDGSLDLDAIERSWDPRTRIMAVTQASNVLGTINDVRALAAIAHDRDALILVDAAQSAPHFPIDVAGLDCDFLAFSGHKLLGPTGIGVLYGRERLLEAMPPWMGGGDMIRSVSFEGSTWNDLPWKFEAGTPNIAGAIGLGAAIDYIDALGFAAIAGREDALRDYAALRLRSVEGLALYGSAPRRCPVFAFNLPGLHAHDVAQYLDREGIAVRAGHHCAQPLMKRLGIQAAARASLSFYNTEEEVDRLAAALVGAQRFYR